MTDTVPHPKLSPTDIAIIKRMRLRGMNFRYIARRFGVDPDTIKRHVEPDWWERRKASNRARKRAGRPAGTRTPQHYVRSETTEPRNPKYDPRRDEAPVYRNEFAELMGEPPVGRSALDALALAPRDPTQDRSSFIDRVFGVPADEKETTA